MMMNSRWHKSYWFTDRQMNFATPAAALPGGDGGGTGTGAGGAGAGTGAPSGGTGGGAPAATGQPAAPAQVDWNAPNTPAHLREGYNKLKADFDKLQADHKPWQTLNVKPDEVGRFQQNYQQVYGELKGIGDSLGIQEKEIADAIAVHGLLPVLDQLRYEAQQADAAAGGDPTAIQQQELEQRIQDGIQTVLSPIQQRENARLVHEGNQLVSRTITELATAAFKTAGMDYAAAPQALRDFIETGVTEALKYDDNGMKALKFEGKVAPIQKAYQMFTSMWDAAYLARRQMEGGIRQQPPGPGRQQPAQGAGKQPTLEQMIDDPNAIRAAQNKPAYST
jgi:hypothetical protein